VSDILSIYYESNAINSINYILKKLKFEKNYSFKFSECCHNYPICYEHYRCVKQSRFPGLITLCHYIASLIIYGFDQKKINKATRRIENISNEYLDLWNKTIEYIKNHSLIKQ